MNSFTQRTHLNNIQTLHLHQIIKKLKQLSLLIIRQRKGLCKIRKFSLIYIEHSRYNLFSQVDLELSKSNLAMGEIKMADSRWQNIGARSAQINASKENKKL